MNQKIVMIGLGILVWLSAFGLVYTKHHSRQLFAELQRAHEKRDALHVEWTQLLLEQGTWASYSRIEALARQKLEMERPSPGNVQVIE